MTKKVTFNKIKFILEIGITLIGLGVGLFFFGIILLCDRALILLGNV